MSAGAKRGAQTIRQERIWRFQTQEVELRNPTIADPELCLDKAHIEHESNDFQTPEL
jgi:hypothetical protein